MSRMTETDKLSLVALAGGFGMGLEEAWRAVDLLPADISLREASFEIRKQAFAPNPKIQPVGPGPT